MEECLVKYAKSFGIDESDIKEIETSECGVCMGFIITDDSGVETKYFYDEESLCMVEEDVDGDTKEASYRDY